LAVDDDGGDKQAPAGQRREGGPLHSQSCQARAFAEEKIRAALQGLRGEARIGSAV